MNKVNIPILGNEIGPKGGKVLSRALMVNTTLKSLRLNGNDEKKLRKNKQKEKKTVNGRE